VSIQPTDLHQEYENFVETGEYDYGEYFQQIDFPERILESAQRDHLREGLAEFFYNEKFDKVPDRHSRQSCFKKAEMMLEGDLRYGDYLESYNGENGLHEAVREAVSLGYIWKFRLETPWHPSFFFSENRLYTYPFQHKFAVLYTGQAKHIFFSKAGKWDIKREEFFGSTSGDRLIHTWATKMRDEEYGSGELSIEDGLEVLEENKEKIKRKVQELQTEKKIPFGQALDEIGVSRGYIPEYRNPQSILEQGAIYAGNQHTGGEEGSKPGEETAVWMGFLDKAKSYPHKDAGTSSRMDLYDGSVVLEVEVPTKWLAIKGHKGVSHGRIEDLEDCLSEYNSPLEMSQDLSRDDEFVVPSSTGRLPLNYVKGVWDKGEFPGTPHFMSLEKFVGLMEKKFPERMPSGEGHIEPHEVDTESLDKLKKEFEIFEETRSKAKKFLERVRMIDQRVNTLVKNAETGDWEGFEDSLNQLEEYIDYLNNHHSEELADELESLNMEPAQQNISLKQLLSRYEDENSHITEREIAVELMEAQKAAANAWERGDHEGAKKVIAEAEQDISRKKLTRLKTSPEELLEVLEYKDRSLQKIQQKLIQEISQVW
jgi:hypothetical protein